MIRLRQAARSVGRALGQLTDPVWWTDVLERAGRAGVTVVLPVVLLVAGTGHLPASGVLLVTASTAAVAFALVVLRALSGLRAPTGASYTVDATDRAIAAAASAVASILAADGFDLLHADPRQIVLTAAGAALTALIFFVTNPPSSQPEVVTGRHEARQRPRSRTGRVYGWTGQTPDHRDYRWLPTLEHIARAAQFVDLTSDFPEAPYDQDELGSCVSNATAGILDFARVKQHLPALLRPARLFIYWFGRKIGGYPQGEDTGLEVRDGLKAVATYGAPPEAVAPYVVADFAKAPSTSAVALARTDVATAYGQVNQGADVDAAVAGGHPVAYGMDVYESFEADDVARTGIVPVPDRKRERKLGGHCMVIVSTQKDGAEIPGAVAGRKYRRVRNSWGVGWGDGGYCWIPVDILDGSDASDFWILTAVSEDNPPQPPVPIDPDQAFAATLRPWAAIAHTTIAGNRRVAAAARVWLKSKGL